ncbi:acyl CoA binding protein family [Polyplosphaeria fusca]|uniref:Acyl CoA binding protein family n=1 Tax=Polyplosphaeria fusca TaxID=682080 RepID=A0A9P4QVB8_9PLEO|nr:acyl CoA binding protein family [Polyplosphaeria fusca]
MPSAKFQKAWDESSKLGGSPSNDEMLEMYAYGKIAKGEEAKPAGVFDLKGKAKYNKYQEKVKEGVSQADAEKKYVELVEGLKSKYGLK